MAGVGPVAARLAGREPRRGAGGVRATGAVRAGSGVGAGVARAEKGRQDRSVGFPALAGVQGCQEDPIAMEAGFVGPVEGRGKAQAGQDVRGRLRTPVPSSVAGARGEPAT